MKKNIESCLVTSCGTLLFGLIVLGIPFGIAVWGFRLATDGFINGKIGLVAFGFLVMFVCFWSGFDLLFSLLYQKVKGADARVSKGWKIAVLVLSLLAIVFLARDFFDPRSVLSISRAVSVVCHGEGVPAAGVYQSGNDIHIVLMGKLSPSGKLNSEWKPGLLGDVELVICPESPAYTLTETCRYSMGGTVERYRENQRVRLMIAQTGEVLASKVFTADPRDCPYTKMENDNKDLRGSIPNGLIEKWVSSVLASRASTPTPTPTPTPIQTSTPTPLPEEVTFDTIGNYPAGHLVILLGRLALTDNIECSLSECGLLLENPANPSQTITVFIPVGVYPNQMKPLPDQYTKSDIQVQLNDGTFAVVGYRIRVTGKACSSTSKDACISDIIKIELFQLK